jgi:hypothetical protein
MGDRFIVHRVQKRYGVGALWVVFAGELAYPLLNETPVTRGPLATYGHTLSTFLILNSSSMSSMCPKPGRVKSFSQRSV